MIAVLAIVLGSLFVTAYSMALGDPVPHRIDAAVVGDPTAHAHTVSSLQGVANDSLDFRRYATVHSARHALDQQNVYAVLDLKSQRPTLYVASAAGASVARVLERISAVDPGVRVVDTHPLGTSDPNGLEVFYLMLIATIIGFFTVFQVRQNAGGLSLRRWTTFVLTLAVAASFVFTLVVGTVLHLLALPVLESWGILSLQIIAAASFTSLMSVLIGRWAVIPTWLFFVILGNSASGGAVSPPLLPRPLAFVSQWLPSGATVTALREAVYFPADQHTEAIAVLATWAAVLFTAMLVVSHRLGKSPGEP
ncbi:MAG: rane protein [Marmoricola sp.]|nr:rane protein [Marmoricola sp.]